MVHFKEIVEIEIRINDVCFIFVSLLELSQFFSIIDYKSNQKENENNKKKIFEIKKCLQRKRGRSKIAKKNKDNIDNSENLDNNTKRHTSEELVNATKKIIIEFKRIVHRFIKSYTGFKFFEPTIYDNINKENNIVKLLQETFYTIYTNPDYTLPKNIKGVENLRHITNKEEKRKMKKKLLITHKVLIDEKKDNEIKKNQKPMTAILDLTFLDFFEIFVEYGYKNDNLTIKIDEEKYGFDEIKLKDIGLKKNFKTYSEIKYKFHKKEEKLEKYRKHLKDFIKRALKND